MEFCGFGKLPSVCLNTRQDGGRGMIRDALSEHLSFGHVEDREEGDRTMSDVFGFVISGLIGIGRQGWRDAFEGLDARAFVQAKQVLVRALVDLDDMFHLLEEQGMIEHWRISGWSSR